jgi:hypothetical protein
MGLTVTQIQHRLAQFKFLELFVVDLGWASCEISQSCPQFPNAMPQGDGLKIRGLAQGGLSTAITIEGDFSASCFAPRQLYPCLNQLKATIPDPLVIWLNPHRQRSLWCWISGAGEHLGWHTHVVIHGQGDLQWATRLARLPEKTTETDSLDRYLSSPAVTLAPLLLEGFHHSWQGLMTGLTTIPTAAERRHYALQLLLRLIAMTALQQRQWLTTDPWYLHNQFGRSQQQGENRFFADVWQPLCQQGLSLPFSERPLAVQQSFGSLPFLPTGPFQSNALDQKWGHLPISDAAFEPALAWLGDVLMATTEDMALEDLLLPLLERGITPGGEVAVAPAASVVQELCDRSLHQRLLDCANGLGHGDYPSLSALMMTLSPTAAGSLLTELGEFVILDPACGSGRYLVTALHSLADIAWQLMGIVAQDPKISLPHWLQPITSEAEDSASPTSGCLPDDSPHQPPFAMVRHLLGHSLFGLDQWPLEVASARLQLFLAGLRYASTTQELASLPDLSLNILAGNALIGLIRVDSERFDQVAPRSKRPQTATPQEAAALQGNLLQPLFAETYQSILAERQVRLEHYRSQTQLLAEAGHVPAYAQADFLRERLEDLNQIAQDKLKHLLWSECSQQLGIRQQQPDASGKRQFRPLQAADIEAVNPFHWGFYFNRLLQERGGFDVILGHFPIGIVQPTEAEFATTHEDLFQEKAIVPSTFGRHARQILSIDADLTRAWLNYRSQYSFPSQYFRRSGQYPYSSGAKPGRAQGRLYWSRLFLERSLQLLRPGGCCGVMLEPFWSQTNSQRLRHWLQTETRLELMIDLANYRGLWGDLPARTTVSLLWLKKGGSTQGDPYVAYRRAAHAITPEELSPLLQRLIDLAEEGESIG